MEARMECEMTGSVIGAGLRAPQLCSCFGFRGWTLFLEPRRLHGSSIFTTAREFTQPLATAAPANKTHHEERLCLDPHRNVFHMCSPSPSLHLHPQPPTLTSPPFLLPPLVSPPIFFFAHHTFSFEKKKKIKNKTWFHLYLRGCPKVLVKQKITNRVKGVSHNGTPNSNILFPLLTGEGEEVHAPSGQPEGPRCGKKLHVQQAHILHF